MSFYHSLCILAAMAFAIAFMNQYIVRMQTTIAITSGALLLSLVMLILGKTLWPGLQDFAINLLGTIDFEDFVLSKVQAGASIIGLYPATKEENLEEFKEWRTKNGR